MMRFSEAQSVTLDANGNGSATITCPAGTVWLVTLSTVHTIVPAELVQAPAEAPAAALFRGAQPTPAGFIEATATGDADRSDTRIPVPGGESLTTQWTGGTPGALAIFEASGFAFTPAAPAELAAPAATRGVSSAIH